jgi:hypothetical protein
VSATPEGPTPASPLGPLRVALLTLVVSLPMAFICPGGSTSGSGGGSGTPAPSPRLKAVQDYTTACLKAIHLDPAKDLIGPWDCMKGNRLELRVGGVSKDIGKCTGAGCGTTYKEGAGLPSECDYPTWLDNACYGNSYVQEIPTSNPRVKAVLLCRHKHRLSNKSDNFDDIAIIANNQGNGETCWFQAEESGKLDGTVHGPFSPQVKQDFWFDPVDTMGVYCVKCHDNGPFMNSRWMRNTISLEDLDTQPYHNSTPPFDQWPQPVWVELDPKKDELADGEFQCTYCHKIAAGLLKVDPSTDPRVLGGRDFNTCKTWIARSTGTAHPKATAVGRNEEVVYWMPDDGSGRSPHDGSTNALGIGHKKADFEKTYRKHVDKLLECCREMGKQRSKPPQAATLPDGCREFKPKQGCPLEEVGGKCPVAVP